MNKEKKQSRSDYSERLVCLCNGKRTLSHQHTVNIDIQQITACSSKGGGDIQLSGLGVAASPDIFPVDFFLRYEIGDDISVGILENIQNLSLVSGKVEGGFSAENNGDVVAYRKAICKVRVADILIAPVFFLRCFQKLRSYRFRRQTVLVMTLIT